MVMPPSSEVQVNAMNKDFKKVIKAVLANSDWVFISKTGSKHPALLHSTGVKLPIPLSSGDRRALMNFQSSVRKVEQNGNYRLQN